VTFAVTGGRCLTRFGEFERVDRSFPTDGREKDGHIGKADMASNGIASDASAARPESGTASGASAVLGPHLGLVGPLLLLVRLERLA
jgi:hypothetical protein